MPVTRRGLVATGLVLATAGAVAVATISDAGATTRRASAPQPQTGGYAQGDRYAPKGRPPGAGVTAAADSGFIYSYAMQNAVSDGLSAAVTVARPTLDSRDFHTLAELAAESADGSQIVEVGWTVDRSVNGDADPHLFVFHWVDGQGTCYNGCGFVPSGTAVQPGTKLPANTTQRFAIRHDQGAWWIEYNGDRIGSFPDSIWGGRYTRTGLVQWFGEVAAGSDAPCTDMGNGRPAADPGAATFSGMALTNGPAVNARPEASNAGFYSAQRLSATSYRFGGPGAC